jgi:hypothetical protein
MSSLRSLCFFIPCTIGISYFTNWRSCTLRTWELEIIYLQFMNPHGYLERGWI